MEDNLKSIKENILKQIMERTDKFEIDFLKLSESHFRKRLEVICKSLLKENKISLTHHEQDKILSEIISDLLGLGPIEKFLKDPNVTEIMVNGPKQVYIEKNGNIELTDIVFKDDAQLMYFIDKIVSPIGRRITEFEPYVDARLKDGSRVNIVKSPISSIGPLLTIRKFSHRIFTIEDLINLGTLDQFSAEFLKACVVSRLNILISGGASSGKTTLLNILGSFIPEGERVITIEDTRELRIPRVHTISLETRPPNIEGKGEITIGHLLKNSLHMRPDRIIIGEVRGEEVLDMIQAMNAGHEGSMATLHANSPLDALERLEILALMGSHNISIEVAKRQIISNINLVIHMVRFPDGSRKITQISEVIKSKEYLLQDIFIFDEEINQPGKLKLTGKIPTFYPRLKKKANYLCQDFELK
jgi:pilus assembly protein CpaF